MADFCAQLIKLYTICVMKDDDCICLFLNHLRPTILLLRLRMSSFQTRPLGTCSRPDVKRHRSGFPRCWFLHIWSCALLSIRATTHGTGCDAVIPRPERHGKRRVAGSWLRLLDILRMIIFTVYLLCLSLSLSFCLVLPSATANGSL